MTLPAPAQDTFTVGEILTAALMNSNVRDAVDFLASPPIAVLYQATAQSLASGSGVTITFDGEVVDTYSGHSNSSSPGTYTAQVAGWYLMIGEIWFNSNATGTRRVDLLVNGTLASHAQPSSLQSATNGGGTAMQQVTLAYLNVGDTVIMQGTQNSGGALSLTSGASWLALLWVHA